MAAGADTGRSLKRQKLTNGTPASKTTGTSRLFAPYRTVGLVSPTAVPFTSVPLGKTTFQITTSVGRSLQTYDLRRGLNLVFITRPQTPEPITASIAWKEKVFAAWGGTSAKGKRGVWVFARGKREQTLEVPQDLDENIQTFCIFGAWCVGVCSTQLLVWKTTGTGELYTVLRGTSPVPLTNCVASLPTFLNKLLVGRQDGSAEIWNVSSGKLIYTVLPPSTSYGAVTAVEPTPALSIVAIAYSNGALLLHDIRSDQTVMELKGSPSPKTAISSISFRSDGLGAGEDGRVPGVMATASNGTGDITLWDLNNGGRKAGVLRAAHANPTKAAPGGVSKIQFLPGQAILVSSGNDNSLKTWIFDATPFSPVPRILHTRGGHGAAVTRLQFLPTGSDGADDSGKWLVAASEDQSLWGWSLRRDGQSTELSQGNVQSKAKKQGLLSSSDNNRDTLQDLKCPPITSIACSLNRDGGVGAVPGKHPIWQRPGGASKKVDAEIAAMTGWESVVTAHQKDSKARTWFWGRKRAGRWALPTSDDAYVTSITVSPCGTFAAVGSEKGGIDMYNLQSGMHRQRFPARLTPQQAKQLKLDLEKDGLLTEEDESHKKRQTFYRGQGKHGAAVVGLAIDSLNSTLVSAGADGRVKFWDFNSGLLRTELIWPGVQILGLRLHRGTDLLACAYSDGCVRIVDISTQRLIRELWPARNASIDELKQQSISDFCFSEDARWVAASYGRAVLLFDLATGHLIDAFMLRAPCTSLALSPTGEYLATASKDSVGVDIWSNKTLFTHVSTRHISADELFAILSADDNTLAAPTVSGEGGQALIAASSIDDNQDSDDDNVVNTIPDDIDNITSDLLSLSLVPRSRWQNLVNLDLLRQRNKPTEAPQKPEKAPFFLPSVGGDARPAGAPPARLLSSINPQTTTTSSTNNTDKERSHVLLSTNSQDANSTSLSTLLHNASQTNDFAPIITHLSHLTPAAADVALRSLSPLPYTSSLLDNPDARSGSSANDRQESEMTTFIHALTSLLRDRNDFELGQAWMNVFIRLHGDLLTSKDGDGEGEGVEEDGAIEALRTAVREWRDAAREERERIGKLVGYCSGVVGWLRAVRV